MPGTFVLSLDCEGKWGFADQPHSKHISKITDDALHSAYTRLVDLLGRYDVPATFAFVGLFILDNKEFDDIAPNTLMYGDTNWMEFPLKSIANNDEGWFGKALLDIVANSGVHEIASHGFSHIPFHENLVSDDTIDLEFQGIQRVSEIRSQAFKTFIFPRNIVGFEKKFAENGFEGIRVAPSRKYASSALEHCYRLVSLSTKRELTSGGKQVVHIPGGSFFPHRAGLKKLIPDSYIKYIWSNYLKSAVDNNSVAHVWLHPHNLIGDKANFDALEEVLNLAAHYRDKFGMDIQTQEQLVENYGVPN